MAAATYSVTAGTTAVAALAAGASGVYVAAYVDGEERGQTFIPEGAFGGSTVANTVLPQLSAVWQGSDQLNPVSGGPISLELTFPAGSAAVSSPHVVELDEEVTVVYLANNQGANTL